MWRAVRLCSRGTLRRHGSCPAAVMSGKARHQSNTDNEADARDGVMQQTMAHGSTRGGAQRRGRLVRPSDAHIAALIDEATSLSEACAVRPDIMLDTRPTPNIRRAGELYGVNDEGGIVDDVTDNAGAAKEAMASSRHTKPPYSSRDDGDGGVVVNLSHKASTHETAEENAPDMQENVAAMHVVCDPAQLRELREQDRQQRQRDALRQAPLEELLTQIAHYLRATDNVHLVSAAEEDVLFPVLLTRLHELHVSQMLDLVELHWARSTLARYGTRLKDLLRDRIALIATTAAATSSPSQHKAHNEDDVAADVVAHAASSAPAASHTDTCTSRTNNGEGNNNNNNDDEVAAADDSVRMSTPASSKKETLTANTITTGDGDYLYVDEQRAAEELQRRDAILAQAAQEMTAATVLRCVTVMGLSAGHRKRDLDFFRILGSYLAFYINQYKDPHDLVRVLTAFARAKIVPSPRFLALLARRLPVLNKHIALEPLPCYRAMSNFARMGYTGINLYRFLADCMLRRMEDSLAAHRTTSHAATPHVTPPPTITVGQDIHGSPAIDDATQDVLQHQQKGEMSVSAVANHVAATPRCETSGAVQQARATLRQVTGLKSSMLTRWLLVLARSGAPHQQYMRPLLPHVLLPALPYLPPPSFSRLLHAARVFGAADIEFTAAVIDCMCHTLLPQRRLFREDVLSLMHLLQRGDRGPIPHNLDAFVRLCHDCFIAPATTSTTVDDDVTGTKHHDTGNAAKEKSDRGADSEDDDDVRFATPLLPLRPADMYIIATYVRNLRLRRDDIDLDTLAPFVDLMDNFAQRFTHLLRLGVVALAQVDGFLEALELQKQPDQHGHMARLREQRRQCWQRCSLADDAPCCATPTPSQFDSVDYDSRLDIDVKAAFHAIAMVNESRTFGTYRPVSGPLLVDFRNALARLSALDLLEAVDLYEKASPGTLHAAPARVLCRSLLAKLAGSEEEVTDEESHTLRLQPATEQLLTRDDLRRLCVLLRRTPLTRLRTSHVTWQFVLRKAERLQMSDIAAEASVLLAKAVSTPMTATQRRVQAAA